MNPAPVPSSVCTECVFHNREFLVALGFAAVSGLAHLVWSPITVEWKFVVTTILFVAGLTFWLVREWRRLGQFITRFYCVAVIADVLAEGLLQTVHHCTTSNLLCTGRLFLVVPAFWLVLYPLERWWLGRKQTCGIEAAR